MEELDYVDDAGDVAEPRKPAKGLKRIILQGQYQVIEGSQNPENPRRD